MLLEVSVWPFQACRAASGDGGKFEQLMITAVLHEERSDVVSLWHVLREQRRASHEVLRVTWLRVAAQSADRDQLR
jgi:hypothetical protein